VSYRIPKEAAAAPVQDTDTPPAASQGIQWTAPLDWQVQAASGMRQGSFLVTDPSGASADISVVSFPGSGGDDLANINRWRNQLKLPPVAASELPSQIQGITTAAGDFVVADLAGTAGEKGAARILGAWLRQPERVWFFKMMGPSDLVAKQKDAFIGFLKSVTLSGAGNPGPGLAQASGGANTNDLPKGAGASAPLPLPAQAPMNSMPVVAESGASLVWTAPADWTQKAGSATRKGSYAAGGAEVAITAFPGDVGGVLANVNRWRGQAGLDPVDEAGLAAVTTPLDSNGFHILVADASGGAQSIVAAIVPWNGGTWFFKLTGPADQVAKARPGFLEFLKTVHAP
jgi:hypothetical protein